MPTNDKRLAFADDDRGAVMVMGIFMCSCLVAAMWYLAGLGDAILYHERMQEAADAVAFSDAALHARAMNLLVLINLIMSVILAIRVALRVGKLGCTIAAAVFAALAFVEPALAVAAAPCAAAAEALDQADSAVKPAVEAALHGLMEAQTAISTVTPVAASAGAANTGSDYAPVVTTTVGYRPMDATIADETLPVEPGSQSKLCNEAASSMTQLFDWAIDKVSAGFLDFATIPIDAILKGLVGADNDYFCDLSAGASPTSTASDAEIKKNADSECQDPLSAFAGLVKNFNGTPPYIVTPNGSGAPGSERLWEAACATCHVTCNGFDPVKKNPDGTPLPLDHGVQTGTCTSTDPTVNQAVLDADRLQRDEDLDSIKTFTSGNAAFNSDECSKWAQQDMQTRKSQQEQQQKSEPTPPNSQSGDNGTSQGSSGDAIQPLRVKDFRNGSQEGVFIGAVLGNDTLLRKDAKIVRIGAFKSKRTPQDDPSHAKLPAWAQAEMFFDCGAGWDDDGCNKDEDAMWHFQWKARLRRFDQPFDALMQRLESPAPQGLGSPRPLKSPDAFADDLASDAPAQAGAGSTNAALRRELSDTIKKNGIRDQGAH